MLFLIHWDPVPMHMPPKAAAVGMYMSSTFNLATPVATTSSVRPFTHLLYHDQATKPRFLVENAGPTLWLHVTSRCFDPHKVLLIQSPSRFGVSSKGGSWTICLYIADFKRGCPTTNWQEKERSQAGAKILLGGLRLSTNGQWRFKWQIAWL